MAETITQITQPPEFIESESKLYLDQLRKAIGGLKGADLSKIMGPQFVAGMDPLTQQAIGQASGLGSYAPYLQAAGAATGPTAYQAYMSPYQQDVIGTTLQEYDIQAQKGAQGIPAAAIAAGAFGGGREGVQRAEYQSASDRNRAALQAQLLQQGFGQAQQLASQAFGQQMNLAQAAPQLAGQQIAGLTTLGGLTQAQNQAVLSAQQQLGQAQLQQPLSTAQQYGSGIMGLISGYPGGTQQTIQPTPGALQTILGAGSTLAGIYSALNPRPLFGPRLYRYE
jgi:hypothetical protein